ncbi:MAG: response regulator [Polyangiaceae bacterium]|nr:response regulator [Polyangiaceae bacterium]
MNRPSEGPISTKSSVLVVDDSLTVRMDLRRTLGAAGLLVTACDTLAAARRALAQTTFSLVILDVILPDGDGIDLLHEIKMGPITKGTPVILLSTEVEVHDRIRGLSKGADDYIGKPYDAAYLIDRIRRLTAIRETLGPPRCWRGVGGQRVLAVDDSPTFGSALATQLRLDRHEVVLARSGEEALAFLEIETVDCITMDILMPGMDGLETCRRIKRIPGRRDIPIIMLTSCDDDMARSMGRVIGIDEFVVKDAKLEQVRVHVRRLLRLSRLERCNECRAAGVPSSRRGYYDDLPFDEQVIRAIGLPARVAAGLLENACRRAGLDRHTLTSAELRPLLPALRESLSTFLCPEEAARRIEEIQRIGRQVHYLARAR